MAARRKRVAAKVDSDAAALTRYMHHKEQARKHDAHADLIRSKLRLKGKDIDEYGHGGPQPAKAKPRIVKRDH